MKSTSTLLQTFHDVFLMKNGKHNLISSNKGKTNYSEPNTIIYFIYTRRYQKNVYTESLFFLGYFDKPIHYKCIFE